MLRSRCGRRFIPVLPGSFCAFRWEALKGKPLEKYFEKVDTPKTDLAPFWLNAMLAEDRLLVMYLVAKIDECWTVSRGCFIPATWPRRYVCRGCERIDQELLLQ